MNHEESQRRHQAGKRVAIAVIKAYLNFDSPQHAESKTGTAIVLSDRLERKLVAAALDTLDTLIAEMTAKPPSPTQPQKPQKPQSP